MKKVIVSGLMALTLALPAFAAKDQVYSFQFKNGNKSSFIINQAAKSKEDAFKLAAKECFKKLTQNKYPGEEKGLQIIDICANPKI